MSIFSRKQIDGKSINYTEFAVGTYFENFRRRLKLQIVIIYGKITRSLPCVKGGLFSELRSKYFIYIK